MEEKAAALHTVESAVQALGRGFDVTFDSRLLYCKGLAESRIVEVDEKHTRDFVAFDDLVVANVSRDIRRVQVKSCREASGIRSFHEVSSPRFFVRLLLSESFFPYSQLKTEEISGFTRVINYVVMFGGFDMLVFYISVGKI